MRSSLRSVITCLLIIGSATACSDSATEPGGALRLRIVAGADVTDTASAVLPQALTVEIRDGSGRPVPDVEVLFGGLHENSSYPAVQVASLESNWFTYSARDTTDDRGRARMLVRLGTIAGPGRVLVMADAAGLEDTASYMIMPGAATRVSVAPKDSAVYVGGSYPLRFTLFDRHGNRTEGGADLSAGTQAVSVGGGALRGEAIGRGFVVGRVGNQVDTAWVSVVPRGVVAAHKILRTLPGREGLVLFNMDGSELHSLLDVEGPWGPMAPAWSPDGKRLLFHTGYDGDGGLHTLEPGGSMRRLIPRGQKPLRQGWGRYSRDGSRIYFSGSSTSSLGAIWRVRADGTGAEQIGPPTDTFREDAYASPSPDDTRLIFARHYDHQWWMYGIDLQTGAIEELKLRGEFPRWSPGGEWIAYLAESSIRLMRPDGSGQRVISRALTAYERGFDWSPDGKWLIVRSESAGRLELVQVETGLTLPLPFTTEFNLPAWQPVPGGH